MCTSIGVHFHSAALQAARLSVTKQAATPYLRLGLPFSDKKFFRGIRNKTEPTAVPSEFCLFRERENLEIPFRAISRKRKPLGIPFQTIFGWEKPGNSVPNYFRKGRNLGILFRTIFGREKNLGIPFRTIFGRENTRKILPNHFWEQKTLEKRLLLLAAL
jgi:hypothetical protein